MLPEVGGIPVEEVASGCAVLRFAGGQRHRVRVSPVAVPTAAGHPHRCRQVGLGEEALVVVKPRHVRLEPADVLEHVAAHDA